MGTGRAERRSASIARLRTMPSVQARTLPRAGSKRALLRQIERNASCVTSSASRAVADDPVGQRVGRAAVAVVEDLEGVRVLAVDEGHQVLVGEAVEAAGVTGGHRLAVDPSRSGPRINRTRPTRSGAPRITSEPRP